MVVRQFMLPSDSLSNMVSLLSLVTHIHQDVSTKTHWKHTQSLKHVTKLVDFQTDTHTHLTSDRGLLKAHLSQKSTEHFQTVGDDVNHQPEELISHIGMLCDNDTILPYPRK